MKPPELDLPRPEASALQGVHVDVYDTTLRDGTQREGISLTCGDKLRIARRLDQLGVAFIEGGWPGSNPKDVEFFRRARDEAFTQALVTAFGATRRAGLAPEGDPSMRALLDADTRVCTLFGKSWTLHVTAVLRTTLDENLRLIEDSVGFLRAHGRRVIYDAEHFFDGWVADRPYALATLRAAFLGGAEALVLCDTNGGSMPWDVARAVAEVRAALPEATIGVHTHNDGECAVANALAAVRAGARHVQGTINGYGERCGNANLCSIIPDLELKLGARALPEGRLGHLSDVARFVADVANLALDEHLPFVGKSAFAHKGGVHVAAMRRDPRSYQHIEPERVGNVSRTVLSELSGVGNVRTKLEELGLEADGAEREILEEIKQREAAGQSFEAAEATAALLLRRRAPGYTAPFSLLDFKVMVGHRGGQCSSEATIKIAVGPEILHTAAEGNGPVSALDAALRKALAPAFPGVLDIQLVDYKVRILDGRDGTGAVTRVLIESSDGRQSWCTAGASANILEASWQALADSFEFALGARAEGAAA